MASSESKINKETESRIIRIELTNGCSINGQVNIKRRPGHDRLSDLVSADKEEFLVVFDATLYRPELENPVRHKTMFVNKDHILWATPDEDQK